jgi:hypothetical protein
MIMISRLNCITSSTFPRTSPTIDIANCAGAHPPDIESCRRAIESLTYLVPHIWRIKMSSHWRNQIICSQRRHDLTDIFFSSTINRLPTSVTFHGWFGAGPHVLLTSFRYWSLRSLNSLF